MSQLGMPNRFHRPEGSGARNELERICLIVNPKAGAGRAGRELDTLRRAADRAFARWELRVTEGPGHASELARQAEAEGFELVAAVGGDGTAHEVVGGLVQPGGKRPKAIFTVIPIGTGGDLVRSLRVPRRLNEALWIAATGISLPTDAGLATVSTDDGPREEPFINVAGFGAQGEVVARANRMDKRWGGRAVFLAATLRTVLGYRPARVAMAWSDEAGAERAWEGELLSCFVANGAWCGGGMWVGRGGTMHDGLLDGVLLEPSPLRRQLPRVHHLYDGRVEALPGARRFRATRVEVRPAGDGAGTPVDLDGETPGRLPARFEILPRALHVRGGWVHNPLLQADPARPASPADT